MYPTPLSNGLWLIQSCSGHWRRASTHYITADGPRVSRSAEIHRPAEIHRHLSARTCPMSVSVLTAPSSRSSACFVSGTQTLLSRPSPSPSRLSLFFSALTLPIRSLCSMFLAHSFLPCFSPSCLLLFPNLASDFL